MAGYIALFPVVVVFVLESSVQDKLWSQLPLTKAVTTETCSHRCEFSKIHNYKLTQMTPSRWQTAWLQETKDSRLEQIFPEDRGMAKHHLAKLKTPPTVTDKAKRNHYTRWNIAGKLWQFQGRTRMQSSMVVGRKDGPVTLTRSGSILEY